MPRPYPPPPLPVPAVEDFELDARQQTALSLLLGLPSLSEEMAERIAYVIACYRATADGNADTTVGNTRAALERVLARGRDYEQAVVRLAKPTSGVDAETLNRAMPHALSVIRGEPGADEALAVVVRLRLEELHEHPRVKPATEALRLFCAVLRVTYVTCADPTMPRTIAACRRFALEALSISGIEHADFDSHPERLDDYLQSDIPTG